jgi:hypothetical protein
MTWLLSIILPVKRFLSALWAWLASNPWRWSLVIILALCVALWAKDGALDRARDKIAAMERASKDAEGAQLAVNAKRTDDEKDIANDADLSNAKSLLEAERRAVVYRDRWRVRNICPASQADTAATDTITGDSDGPSSTGDMVAISVADFDRCTANTVRLQSVNAWGQRLIREGLAVDMPAP